MKRQFNIAIKHWMYIAPFVKRPKTASDYQHLVQTLDKLLDIVEDNERHPLIGWVDAVSALIEEYEKENYPPTPNKGISALRFLMDEHKLLQSDLSDMISQGVLSEILNEKRQLNLNQIKLLSKYFNVDPSTFIA